jgi:hemolysin III
VYSVSSIYLLIAGTYTPFALVNLRGAWGWSLFSVVWRFALFGIVLEAVAQQRVRVLSVVLYLGLGWLVAIAVKPLLDSVATGGLVLLLLPGGLAYSDTPCGGMMAPTSPVRSRGIRGPRGHRGIE